MLHGPIFALAVIGGRSPCTHKSDRRLSPQGRIAPKAIELPRGSKMPRCTSFDICAAENVLM
jgi:hypothetical protein